MVAEAGRVLAWPQLDRAAHQRCLSWTVLRLSRTMLCLSQTTPRPAEPSSATVNQLTPGKDITTSPKEAIDQSTTQKTKRQRNASKVDGQQAGTADAAPKRVCIHFNTSTPQHLDTYS